MSSQTKKETPPAEAQPEEEANDEDDEDNEEDASDAASASESSNDDSGSEAAPSDEGEDEEEGDDDYDGEHTRKKPRTRAARSQDQRKPSLPSLHERKPSTSSTAAPQSPVTPVTPGALPAARQYVADKMAAVIRTIIGDGMDESEASEYGHAVESTLFSTLNETIKGKQTAGGRYK